MEQIGAGPSLTNQMDDDVQIVLPILMGQRSTVVLLGLDETWRLKFDAEHVACCKGLGCIKPVSSEVFTSREFKCCGAVGGLSYAPWGGSWYMGQVDWGLIALAIAVGF